VPAKLGRQRNRVDWLSVQIAIGETSNASISNSTVAFPGMASSEAQVCAESVATECTCETAFSLMAACLRDGFELLVDARRADDGTASLISSCSNRTTTEMRQMCRAARDGGERERDGGDAAKVQGGERDGGDATKVQGGERDGGDAAKVQGGERDGGDAAKVQGGERDGGDAAKVQGGERDDVDATKVQGGERDGGDATKVQGGERDGGDAAKVQGGERDDGDSAKVKGGERRGDAKLGGCQLILFDGNEQHGRHFKKYRVICRRGGCGERGGRGGGGDADSCAARSS
jgi:hypothetical protein